ncbi:redoxin domain-containing protein [Winogradskyella litorisediminis]|uniref:Redoxin domain-containing protein n=1 Tax=Winogradskyella litorisediminis TaxID=1156618 RepID=A0ABW3N2K0_9FLAO
MKRIIYFAFLSLFLIACEQEPKDSYVIDGKAEGVYNGMRVYLSKVNERGAPIPKDTAIVMNEKFSFNGKVDYPQLYYVTINGTPGRLPIILENGISKLHIDNKILSNSRYTENKAHNVFSQYNSQLDELNEKRNLAKKNLSESTFLKNDEVMKTDAEILEKIENKIKEFHYEYIKSNNDSYATLTILNSQLRTRDLEYDKIVELYENLDNNLKKTAEGQFINEALIKIKKINEAEKATAIGATAPKFSAPTPEGDILALDDVLSKGKITIIDFWAAWCGPCRRENPNVVKIYEKYHDKGLEIIGVGLDGRRGQQNPKEAWIKAIKNDNLTWHQVSNLRYFDEIAKMYNVNSIPSMFILDNEGKIVAKNLRGKALELKIGEFLD